MDVTINLPFPVSVNAMFADGKTRRHKSQRYCDWLMEAGLQLNRQRPTPVKGPVRMTYEFGAPDSRRRDLSNLLKGPEDLLVKHGVIEADDNSVVREIRLTWAPVEGVRITIEPIA